MEIENRIRAILTDILNLTEECIKLLKSDKCDELEELIKKRGELINELVKIKETNRDALRKVRTRNLFQSIGKSILQKSKEFEKLIRAQKKEIRKKIGNITAGQKFLLKYKKETRKLVDKEC